jgi:hypothetical protein
MESHENLFGDSKFGVGPDCMTQSIQPWKVHKFIHFQCGNLEGRNHLKNLGMNRKIMSRWILKKVVL